MRTDGDSRPTTREERLAYMQLYDVLPSEEFELELTRQEAFALLAACCIFSDGAGIDEKLEFLTEIEALL